jgi:iron complex transport system ATP-binding protein
MMARSVGFSVGDATLVTGVDLEVASGEVVALIGPNGAGKSTLIGLLGGDLSPVTGSVALCGDPLTALHRGDLALARAVLTQRVPADIPFTAVEVVGMGRFPHRASPGNTRARDDEMVERSMRQTDTIPFARRIYATLSAGERTRVSLARVLAQDTPVVLLDEPTTALDIASQQRIMRVVESLADAGRAVVCVLHDLNAAAAHADRLVLMHEGRIVETGTPEEVLDDALLSAVYGEPMTVVPHPFLDIPLVLPGTRH